ncbi:MAG: hypothetical protein ACRENE_14235 [Polyangiaceae bacterium]
MGIRGGDRLGVVRAGIVTPAVVAARSRSALDGPLARPAELWVAVVSEPALLVGAFQRAPASTPGRTTLLRGSGGPDVHVGAGTVHVALSLERPDVLEPCDAKKIVNRAVRPLLRALTKTVKLAHYFGRDWVSVEHRPAGWVGFAHDSTTGRTLFEAFVAVTTPFAGREARSLLGKTPATLDELAGRSIDPAALADEIVRAYEARAGVEAVLVEAGPTPAPEDAPAEPPWAAMVEEAIGTLGAGPDGRGTFRVGGDLLVSRDALARLEQRVAAAPDANVGRIVDETLSSPGVALEGVASLASIRDVIVAARRRT